MYDQRTLAFDLMLAHSRLAKWCEQTGQTNLVAYHLDEALRSAINANPKPPITNRETLMRYVEKLDQNVK